MSESANEWVSELLTAHIELDFVLAKKWGDIVRHAQCTWKKTETVIYQTFAMFRFFRLIC